MAKKKTRTAAAKKKTRTTAAKKTTSAQRTNRGNDATNKKTTTGSGATMKKKATKRSPASKPQTQVEMKITHDQIAQRAYEIWLAKGRPPGQEEQNWREAEAELRREKSR
jgi:hypothetical protein